MKKAQVDTPRRNSWADEESRPSRPQVVNPAILPAVFREEQHRMNIMIAYPQATYGPEYAAKGNEIVERIYRENGFSRS